MQNFDNFVCQKHFFGGTNESNVEKACYTKTNKPLIRHQFAALEKLTHTQHAARIYWHRYCEIAGKVQLNDHNLVV